MKKLLLTLIISFIFISWVNADNNDDESWIMLITTTSIEETSLSDNDQNFYDTINKRLKNNHKAQVNIALDKYGVIVKNRVNHTEVELKEKLLDRTNKMITELLMKYPADKALPEKVNNIYLSLTLFKFDVMMK